MARTSPWPTVLGTAALIALPVLAAAQTGQAGSTGSQASQTPTAQSDKAYPSTAGAAVQHLTEAKQVLDGIPHNAVTGRNAAKLNQIRREFAALQRSYSANPSHSGSAHSSSAAKPSSKGAAGSWNTQLMALDRDLSALLGASSDTTNPETSGATGTSGTSASSPSAGNPSSASSASLDPNVRSQLEEFRKHITEFAAAASGTQAGGEMSSPDTTGSAGTSGTSSMSTTGTTGSASSTGSTESTANPQSTTSSSQSSPTSSSPSQTGSAAGETAQNQSGQTTSGTPVDAAAAREHLTEARQSLADLTALPQAQQLQGEARTQVSQLISQFNQLITTQDDWRPAYDQVNQTLTALVGSSSASTSSSSTQGAVGTSGSASSSGTITIDPAIRTKLEEFRTHLDQFYASAGGAAAGSATSSGSTTSTEPTGSATSGTSYAGSQAGSTSAASSAAESHIDAIERILDQAGSSNSATGTSGATGSPTGTSSSSAGSTAGSSTGSTSSTSGTNPSSASSSSVTLTQQQIDQIKLHLQQLRTAIKK